MKPLSVRASADADIDAAIDFIAALDPASARKFIDRVEATFEHIASNPGIGSPRHAEASGIEGLRSLAVRGFEHHVFYIELNRSIVVIRVLHGRRDIPSLLAEPPTL